jgi:hypothetical protein
MEGKALARRELQMRVAVRQLRDRDLGFEPAQVDAEAVVQTLAERKMLIRASPM